jgi:sensor domain CHASE-containing protein
MKLNKNITILSFSFSVFFLVILILVTIQNNQNSTNDISSLQIDKIENLISNITYSIDISELVIIDGNIDFNDSVIETIIEPITRNSDFLNIAILPAGIVTHIYPIKGNEKAIGDNIYLMPQRKAEIISALKTKKTVINGPYLLTQGIRATA